MRLSLQVHYAICGIFDLAYNGQGELTQVRVIGERQGIPARYLEQIFQRLRRAELIVGKRGPGGGYTLAREAAKISLRDVVEAVEGPLGTYTPWAEAADGDDSSGNPAANSGRVKGRPRAGARSPRSGASQRDAASGADGGPHYRPDFLWAELSDGFGRVLADITLDLLCRQAAQAAVPRSNAEAYTYQI